MKLFKRKKYDTKESLVAACINEDAAAQTMLYNRYKTKLFGVCYRYARTSSEAEDIFQEALLKVFQNLHKVVNPEALDQWVKSIVIRTAINYYNRTTKLLEMETDIDQQFDLISSDDFESILSRIDLETIVKVINQLPRGYRMAINLYLIDGYTHAEIAEMLSISEGTARSQYSKGKIALIKKLQLSGITQYEIS